MLQRNLIEGGREAMPRRGHAVHHSPAQDEFRVVRLHILSSAEELH